MFLATKRGKEMKRKSLGVKTKRLNIYPLSDEEIQRLIDECPDEGLKMAYTQMLDGCKSNPTQRVWYAPWTMEKRDDGLRIGELGFRGPQVDNSVEIGYGINREYEGKGYTTEAVKAMLDWAFDNEEVLFVEAEAEESNAASLRILEKLKFEKYGQGEEGSRFVKEKSGKSYTSLGMSLGMCLGLAIGMTVFDNMTLGMCTGLMLGLTLGAAKDEEEKSKIGKIKKDKYGSAFNG